MRELVSAIEATVLAAEKCLYENDWVFSHLPSGKTDHTAVIQGQRQLHHGISFFVYYNIPGYHVVSQLLIQTSLKNQI